MFRVLMRGFDSNYGYSKEYPSYCFSAEVNNYMSSTLVEEYSYYVSCEETCLKC